MDASLVGTWMFRQDRPFVQDIVLTVFPDGRLVECFRQAESVAQNVPSTMHASPEGDRYRIRTELAAVGYLVSMSRDGEALVIEHRGHRTVCRRLAEAELPVWYSEVIAKAIWR
jgi:hypothetical protein